MKKKYYLNFCRKHQHRNGYVEIYASNIDSALDVAVATFRTNFQQVREGRDFDASKFRDGCVMKLEGT